MVVTPLHIGPSILIGLLLYKYLDLPGLVLGSVIVDLRAIAVVLGFINGPIHGVLHNFIAAIIIGVIGGFILHPFRPEIKKWMDMVFIKQELSKTKTVLSTIIGALIAVLIDSILYSDLSPIYPISGNPFYGLLSLSQIHIIVVSTFMIGLILYLYRAYRQVEMES